MSDGTFTWRFDARNTCLKKEKRPCARNKLVPGSTTLTITPATLTNERHAVVLHQRLRPRQSWQVAHTDPGRQIRCTYLITRHKHRKNKRKVISVKSRLRKCKNATIPPRNESRCTSITTNCTDAAAICVVTKCRKLRLARAENSSTTAPTAQTRYRCLQDLSRSTPAAVAEAALLQRRKKAAARIRDWSSYLGARV